MARDRIKSRASFKSEGWTGKGESAGLARAKASWPHFLGAGFESSELDFGGESGLSMIGATQPDYGLAEDKIASGSPIVSFVVESPAVFKLPSSDLAVCSRSKARAVVGATNPSKIKCPRISET